MKKRITTLLIIGFFSFMQARPAKLLYLSKKNTTIKKHKTVVNNLTVKVPYSAPVSITQANFVQLERAKLFHTYTIDKPNLSVYSKIIERTVRSDINVTHVEEVVDLNEQGIAVKKNPAQAFKRKPILSNFFEINAGIYRKNTFYSQGNIPVYTINNDGPITTSVRTFYDSRFTGNYNQDNTFTFLNTFSSYLVSRDIKNSFDFLHDCSDLNSPEIKSNLSKGINSTGTLSSTNGLTFCYVNDSSSSHVSRDVNINYYNPNTVPNCATNPIPADNAINVDMTTYSVIWDNQADATSYIVYFGTDPNPFNNTPETVTINSFLVSLDAFTTYYWAVIPQNASGQASGCQTWSFTTGDNIYYMTDTGTITTCSGKFYDNGGPNSQYSNFLDQIMTFIPDTTGSYISFYFTSFEVQGGFGTQYDYFEVYNGTDTSNQIGFFNSSSGTVPQELQPVTSSDPSGALTFIFHSDGAVRNTGWEANINCIPAAINEYNNIVGIYPNPNTGIFAIKLKEYINRALVTVYTTTGKLIYSKSIIDTASINIDMTGYAKGLYFVKVLSGKNTYIKKLILI